MCQKVKGQKKEVRICWRHSQRENAPLPVDKPMQVTNGYLLGFRGCLRVFLR